MPTALVLVSNFLYIKCYYYSITLIKTRNIMVVPSIVHYLLSCSKRHYLKLVNTVTTFISSLGGQQSPLLVNVTSSTTSVTTTTADPSSQYTSGHHVEASEPDLGYEITYGDTKFMGHQRYVANRASYDGSDQNSSQHTTGELCIAGCSCSWVSELHVLFMPFNRTIRQ